MTSSQLFVLFSDGTLSLELQRGEHVSNLNSVSVAQAYKKLSV